MVGDVNKNIICDIVWMRQFDPKRFTRLCGIKQTAGVRGVAVNEDTTSFMGKVAARTAAIADQPVSA